MFAKAARTPWAVDWSHLTELDPSLGRAIWAQ